MINQDTKSIKDPSNSDKRPIHKMNGDQYISYLETELGLIEIWASKKGVARIQFKNSKKIDIVPVNIINKEIPQNKEARILKKTEKLLLEYFSGKRKNFSLNLDFNGTKFQKKVFKTLMNVSYGNTISYAGLASKAGYPGAARAVGSCMRKNPLPVLIPCHRVVGKKDLFKYGAGTEIKKKLMKIEEII